MYGIIIKGIFTSVNLLVPKDFDHLTPCFDMIRELCFGILCSMQMFNVLSLHCLMTIVPVILVLFNRELLVQLALPKNHV